MVCCGALDVLEKYFSLAYSKSITREEYEKISRKYLQFFEKILGGKESLSTKVLLLLL